MTKIKNTLRLEPAVSAFLSAEAERMKTSAAVVANEIVKNHMNNNAVMEQEMEKVKNDLIDEIKQSEQRMRLLIVQFLKDFAAATSR